MQIDSKQGRIGVALWAGRIRYSKLATYQIGSGNTSFVDTLWPQEFFTIRNSTKFALVAPHRFLVAVAAALGIVLAICRPLRLTMKSLFIVTTLVACVLGLALAFR
jgi:hypothetical protein